MLLVRLCSGGVVGFELAQGYRRLVTAIFIWADHQINFYFLINFIRSKSKQSPWSSSRATDKMNPTEKEKDHWANKLLHTSGIGIGHGTGRVYPRYV
ncbi:Oidioi.mRNA.OKI2018_I69.PAR.g11600.t1.cds [Oikopleura dioica]|uniref:Oidioi.mRNA.OKI2018_I69.PAR.g11600.t1.cds n=1 Tax=Oikopleura dioica TaxID=34765 RepID=A0ABN7RZF1_OIKDI|nr:Oidioi.mRNA.OKI2018_I69.PAR.g11600.t1.cds [Oikopleura dioica]